MVIYLRINKLFNFNKFKNFFIYFFSVFSIIIHVFWNYSKYTNNYFNINNCYTLFDNWNTFIIQRYF